MLHKLSFLIFTLLDLLHCHLRTRPSTTILIPYPKFHHASHVYLRMARKRVLNALNVLWETLLYAEEGPPVSEVTGIVGEDVLEELNIKVHDLEIDSFGRVSMTIKDPPFLFEILPEAELRKHPLPEEMKPFPEYLKPSERPEDTVDYYWEPEIRAFQVSQYINYFALKPFRKNLGSCSDLAEYRNLSSIK